MKGGERKERGREGGTCEKKGSGERSQQYRIWVMYGSYRGVASSN